ncbi:O-antigen ligase family protein [Aureibaculum sp. A20]|uniref:O-antigen ligase family protein n=1 Tax=Aureibaculum flavum TaxID=2795986 RepID=A0ABS0WKW8_9FLAO|nr:O-antigen ligase family protein [Aureibaculum flavum]MBJ2172618.1 O-antigen ligase family protein [Aureibaculum flavum]
MANYYSIPNKFNRFIILLITLAPFVAYVLLGLLKTDYGKNITVLMYLGVILIFFYAKKGTPVKFPKYVIFYLLFTLYTYISEFYLLDREFKLLYLVSNPIAASLLALIIIENIHIRTKYMNVLLKTSNVIFIVAFIVILLQQILGQEFLTNPDYMKSWGGGDVTESRLVSIYSYIGDAISTGLGFVPIFIIIVEVLGKQNKQKKMLLYILCGVMFVFLTKARWILLNGLLVFLLLFMNNRKNLSQFYKYLILIPIIFVSSLVLLDAYGLETIGIVEDRILDKESGGVTKGSAGTRLLAIATFGKVYWDNPILGKGNIKYGMAGTGEQDYKLKKYLAGRSSQIHVGYLSLFYIYGLVGGLLFLFFLITILRHLYMNAKITGYFGPFVAFLGFAVANLTLVTFSIFETGLLLALIFDKYYMSMNNKQTNEIHV